MFESSEVVGGETWASAAAAPDSSAVLALVEEEGGGTTPNDAPLGRLGATLKWAVLYLRNMASMGAII